MQTIPYFALSLEDGRTHIVEKFAARSSGCNMNVEDVPHIAIPMCYRSSFLFLEKCHRLIQEIVTKCWLTRTAFLCRVRDQ